MAQEVTMTKISTHKRGETGRQGVCMFTFTHGTGNKKKSETKHMTPAQADSYKNQLAGA